MKILVFLHGTITMHATGQGKSREERVVQSRRREQSIFDYANYIPIGNAAAKLQEWQDEGYDICYLSSNKDALNIRNDKSVLAKYDFPEGEIFWRKNGESYAEVAEKVMPDILIEDDCESINGEIETTYYAIDPEKKKSIRQILVKEFEGIDSIELAG